MFLVHAAGPYKPGEANFQDLYMSSYTPGLATLTAARSNAKCVPQIPSRLIVAPDDDGLPAIREEIRRIQRFGSFNTLTGAKANTPDVISHHEFTSRVTDTKTRNHSTLHSNSMVGNNSSYAIS